MSISSQGLKYGVNSLSERDLVVFVHMLVLPLDAKPEGDTERVKGRREDEFM